MTRTTASPSLDVRACCAMAAACCEVGSCCELGGAGAETSCLFAECCGSPGCDVCCLASCDDYSRHKHRSQQDQEAKQAKADGKPSADSTAAVGLQVGDVGVTKTGLRPGGRVIFDGQPFDVTSDGDFIDPGEEVEVIEVGHRTVVRRIP